jgi:hypothetical protein
MKIKVADIWPIIHSSGTEICRYGLDNDRHMDEAHVITTGLGLVWEKKTFCR